MAHQDVLKYTKDNDFKINAKGIQKMFRKTKGGILDQDLTPITQHGLKGYKANGISNMEDMPSPATHTQS